jgi:hypothetical protein
MAVMSQEQVFLVWRQQQQQSNMVGHDPANPSWESLWSSKATTLSSSKFKPWLNLERQD